MHPLEESSLHMPAASPQADELLLGFIEESLDSLQQLAERLNEFRANSQNSEAINAVFRSIHSIKGNAGFFGLVAIKQFSHALENTLDDVRNAKLTLTEPLSRAFLLGFDLLAEMLQQVAEGEVLTELDTRQAGLLEQITQLTSHNDAPVEAEAQLLLEVRSILAEMQHANEPALSKWMERLQRCTQAEPDIIDEETVPASTAAPLFKLADFQGRTFQLANQNLTDAVNQLLEMFVASADNAYTKAHGERFLQSAQAFAELAAKFNESTIAEAVRGAAADFATIFHSPLSIDAGLLSIVWERLSPALANCVPGGLTPVAAAETKLQVTKPVESKDAAAEQHKEASAKNQRTVRVREESLDTFLDHVSRLFITGERLKDIYSRLVNEFNGGKLLEELRQINLSFASQTLELQKGVVALRRVPAAGLLNKFPRMARSLADKLGKRLDVHIAGEEVEIDKSLSEDLDSPLTHMVRNVCDHGIETPEERTAAGKTPSGNLWLRCEQTRTHVVLHVRDDGRGIDPKRLRRKVVDKGIMSERDAEALSDAAAVELIFHPGFSTAEQISEVSGRGVGLDVVRTKLREHGGDVHVESIVGQGTTFRLEIPLRQVVVVVDSLLVSVAENIFVIPFEHIREIVELNDRKSTVQGEPVVMIRGEPFGALEMNRVLELPTPQETDPAHRAGVLVHSKHGQLCFLVDRVLGQRKVVVNSLEGIVSCNDMIRGVAQLGAGQLALMLSVPDIIRRQGQ